MLSTSVSAELSDQLALEAETIGRLAASPDGQEGMSAFVDKRRPQFAG